MRRCDFCNVHTQWLLCKDGERRLFDGLPVPVEHDPGRQGYVTGQAKIRGRVRWVMTPLGHVGRVKADAVRHVVLLHSCEPYRVLRDRVFGPPGS